MQAAIVCQGLKKSFGKVSVLEGINLEVSPGKYLAF